MLFNFALPASIQIDMEGLKHDHATRTRALDQTLGASVVATDWNKVWNALNPR